VEGSKVDFFFIPSPNNRCFCDATVTIIYSWPHTASSRFFQDTAERFGLGPAIQSPALCSKKQKANFPKN
jgi:hypothetical protein